MTIVQTQWRKKKWFQNQKPWFVFIGMKKSDFIFCLRKTVLIFYCYVWDLWQNLIWCAWTVMNSATRRWGKFAFCSPRFFIRVRRTTIKRKVCHLFLRWWPIPANIFLKKIWLSTLKPILYMYLVMFKKKRKPPWKPPFWDFRWFW